VSRIAVLGAGAWGTAISCVLSSRLETVLWAQRPEQAQSIQATRRNERYLPGIEIPKPVAVTSDLAHAVKGTQLVLAATPVAGLRDVLQKLDAPIPVVWLCKGFEEGTGLLPHQIAAETLGETKPCGALSGPSFAEEVAQGLPCALTLASTDA
jgi:glycerol-3-phosphate dehydrogenase (NAD(P)+)